MSVFDEQTDFSFLKLTEPKTSVVSKKTKKDRSVQHGDITITITLQRHVSDELRIAHSRKMKALHRKLKKEGKSLMRHTIESKAKISEVQRGKPKTPEQKQKMRDAKLGRKKTPEHVRNLSEAMTRIWASKKKPLVTPAGAFQTIDVACKFFGVSNGTMKRWMKEQPKHIYYIKD